MSEWEAKRLGELLLKTETVDPTKAPDTSFTYIDVSSVSNLSFAIEETQRLLGKDAPSRARRSVAAGDVIFATVRPTLQRIAIIPEHLDGAVCSTGYFVMRAGPRLDRSYLFYWLFSEGFRSEMESRQRGASYPAVTDGDIREQVIPLPALEEQRRIVAVLDEAFAAIATATANAERNLANARELFSSTVPRIMAVASDGGKSGGIADIGGRVYTGPFGSLLHKRDYQVGGIPLVNPSHIENGRIVPSDDKCVASDTADRLSSYRMKVGDIVFGRRGEMGRCAVVTEAEEGFLCGTGSFFIRPFAQTDPQYLAYLLRSAPYRKKLEALAGGATMPNLSNTALSNLRIKLPDYSTQQDVVGRIDVAEAEVESVACLITRKIAELTALKQSLLHRAFSGELTKREPLAA